MTLLGDFERIVILKTEIFRVNSNLLSLEDLEQIQECEYDLNMDILTYYDLDNVYNSDYDKVDEIYKKWCDEIIVAFNNISEKLNGKMK